MPQPICREIGEASELLGFLANPDRLAILRLLFEGERTVMQLKVAPSLRQPSLSQQVGILRRAKLIEGAVWRGKLSTDSLTGASEY